MAGASTPAASASPRARCAYRQASRGNPQFIRTNEPNAKNEILAPDVQLVGVRLHDQVPPPSVLGRHGPPEPTQPLAGRGDVGPATVLREAIEHGVEVRPVGQQPGEDGSLVGTAGAGAPLAGEARGSTPRGRRGTASLSPEAASFDLGELAQRLEEPVPRRRAGVEGEDHRLVDEPVEQVDDVELVDDTPCADPLRRLEVESAPEHGEAVEQRLLLGGEQIVGPLDRGEERLVALAGGPAAAREEAEPLAQPVQDVRRQHRP